MRLRWSALSRAVRRRSWVLLLFVSTGCVSSRVDRLGDVLPGCPEVARSACECAASVLQQEFCPDAGRFSSFRDADGGL